MQIKSKYYKLSKMKTYFKKTSFFFLINTTTSETNITMMQRFTNLNLEGYKFSNNLVKQLLKKSLFNNYLPLIKGIMKLIKYNTTKNFQIEVYLKRIVLISVVLNNKLYLSKHINLSNNFRYNENCVDFFKTLKMLINQSSKVIVSK